MPFKRVVRRAAGAIGLPVLLLALIFLTAPARAQTPEGINNGEGFWIPLPPMSVPAISGNGTTVVGSNFDGPFAWIDGTGEIDLGFGFGCSCTNATAVSFDGSYIVGATDDSVDFDFEAYYWWDDGTSDGAYIMLGGLSGDDQSGALGVSTDGTFVVGAGGYYDGFDFIPQAIYWRVDNVPATPVATGPLVLPTVAGYDRSYAYDVAVDGSGNAIVVGISGYTVLESFLGSSLEGGQATFWAVSALDVVSEHALPFLDLGATDPGDSISEANAISTDGSTIVGSAANSAEMRIEAVRWTGTNYETVQPLGTIAGAPDYFWSAALAVNGDGSVIVGYTGAPLDFAYYDTYAFVWTEAAGMQSIEQLLIDANGTDSDWDLISATGISDDGETITGFGYNPDGDGDYWILRDASLLSQSSASQSLASLGFVSEGAHTFINGFMGGAQEYALQHAPGTTTGGSEPLGYAPDLGANFPNIKKRDPDLMRWRLFGTAEGYGSEEIGGGHGIGQFGGSYVVAPDLVVGGSLGVGGSKQDLAFDGEASFLGLAGTLFAAYVPESGFQAVFTTTGSGIGADIERGYAGGSSEGETDGFGVGAALRVGYAFGLTPETSLTPFASVNATYVELGGYAETTGPLPAIIEDIEDTAVIAKLGLEAKHDLTDATWIWTSAAWAHRDDDEGAAVSATISGLFGITGATAVLDQDWAELTGGISVGLSDGLSRFTASATLYVPGNDLSAIGRVGYSRAF